MTRAQIILVGQKAAAKVQINFQGGRKMRSLREAL